MDGRSLLPVLTGGEGDAPGGGVLGAHRRRHRRRDGRRSRSAPPPGVRYKYIRNLAPGNAFSVGGTKNSEAFQSWQAAAAAAAAAAGVTTAGRLADRITHRPAEELYVLEADPLELNNLAGTPELRAEQAMLSAALDEWMTQQGDRGLETRAGRPAAPSRVGAGESQEIDLGSDARPMLGHRAQKVSVRFGDLDLRIELRVQLRLDRCRYVRVAGVVGGVQRGRPDAVDQQGGPPRPFKPAALFAAVADVGWWPAVTTASPAS